jgi:NitT/TauT family transport system substrate-binding protein
MPATHVDPEVPVIRPPMPSRSLPLLLLVVLVVAACAGGSSPSPSTSAGASASPAGSASGAAPSPSPQPTKLVVGLGYNPSVQFAQFYLADQRGYYADAGLEVEFQNKIDPDLIRLVGQGAVDVALADGTSVIPAVSQGITVRYAATIYAKFPSIVFAKEASGIATAADLKGRTIGTPGQFGSGWIMLQALLQSAGLTTDDVMIEPYPDFGQLAGVEQGAVDAATGFVNNEPVRLERSGTPTVVLRVDEIVPLPGNGLIVGEETLATKTEALRAFVAATLRAMDAIVADPQVGLDATLTAVPELASDEDYELAVLEATIDTWQSPLTEAQGLGAIDPAAWQASIEYLAGLPGDLVPNPVTVDQLVTTDLLP